MLKDLLWPVCTDELFAQQPEIPYELRYNAYVTSYWMWLVQQKHIPACFIRVGLKTAFADISVPEDIDDLAEKTNIPDWVIRYFNRGYDLDQLFEDDMILIPFDNKYCVDPIRVIDLTSPPSRPSRVTD